MVVKILQLADSTRPSLLMVTNKHTIPFVSSPKNQSVFKKCLFTQPPGSIATFKDKPSLVSLPTQQTQEPIIKTLPYTFIKTVRTQKDHTSSLVHHSPVTSSSRLTPLKVTGHLSYNISPMAITTCSKFPMANNTMQSSTHLS
jgi:hypothetical protein